MNIKKLVRILSAGLGIFVYTSSFAELKSWVADEHCSRVWLGNCYLRTNANQNLPFVIYLDKVNGVTSGDIKPFTKIWITCAGEKLTTKEFQKIGEAYVLPPHACNWDVDGTMFEIGISPKPSTGQSVEGRWGNLDKASLLAQEVKDQ